MLECVTEADSWAQDDQNRIAMVWFISAMQKVLHSEDTSTEKCLKMIFRLSWTEIITVNKARTWVHGWCEVIVKQLNMK